MMQLVGIHMYFRRACLSKLIFFHFQLALVKPFWKMMGYKFSRPSVTFCCYDNQKSLVTSL